MSRLLLPIFMIILVAAAGACASGGNGHSGGSHDPITARDIQAVSVGSAFDVVSRLRPQWMRSRGTPSIQNPGAGHAVVFVDHFRYGPLQSLQQIRLTDIESIQYLNPRDATTLHGTGHVGGIILVTTKR